MFTHERHILSKQRIGFLLIFGASAALLFSQTKPSDADVSNPRHLNSADSRFMEKAAAGGMAEVKLGELAQEKASNQEVKNFGKMMAADHSKGGDQLKQLAATKGVTLPTSMNSKDQATYNRLSKLSGSEFDREYMRDMVKDHEGDISEFRRETQAGKDADTKAFANQTMPMLENHLNRAIQVNSEIGATSQK